MFFDELCDEIKLRIFKNLSAQNLGQLSQVSRNVKCLSEDDSLWRALLIDNFYFTNETVERLKNELHTNYKEVYRYWALLHSSKNEQIWFLKGCAGNL